MLKNDKIITDIIGFVEKICKMYMEGENEDENVAINRIESVEWI